MEMQECARLATKRYLRLTGRQVIDDDFKSFIVNEDDEGIGIVDIGYTTNDFKESCVKPMAQDDFEELVWMFFKEHHDYADVRIRYDIIELHVIHDDRAIVKHSVNVEWGE